MISSCIYYFINLLLFLLLFSSGSLPVPPTKASASSPSKTVLFAEIQNLKKTVTKQSVKIDGISNRLSSGLQGPRTRSQWVKEL